MSVVALWSPHDHLLSVIAPIGLAVTRRSALVIDLGGVHGPLEATVDLDAVADRIGLVRGERYPIHLFFAERHTSQSTFTIETTVTDPFVCD